MKNIRGSTSDIISHLPESITESILVLMPIRDAVRTSVLSKKWRYKWTRIPHLVFENTLWPALRPNQLPSQKTISITIYHVLLLHRGPILKFTLSISGLKSCPEIDALITVLSRHKVRELTLQIWKGEPHKLPSSLFSCEQLTHLNLRSCVFKPPTTFKGFSKVVCLILCEVIISPNMFASLVSSCPLLEQLTFESSTSIGSIEIVAPNLKVLNLVGIFKSICVKNAPHLANASISSKVVENGGDNFDWVTLFHGLPVLDNLHLGYHYVKFLVTGCVERRFPTMRHLKFLQFSGIYLGVSVNQWIPILVMMNRSPKLQKVTIEVVSTHFDDEDVALRFCNESKFSLNQLREVEMHSVTGTMAELRFMKLLLAKSPTLATMVVKPNPVNVSDGGLRILKELSQFPRLSPKAKITYIDPNEYWV